MIEKGLKEKSEKLVQDFSDLFLQSTNPFAGKLTSSELALLKTYTLYLLDKDHIKADKKAE
jgi:hypothetical protein